MRTDADFIFGPSGPFAQTFPGYEPRAGQMQYAKSVEGAILHGDGRPILVEGPTGVGKSFAYLVPAIGSVLTQPFAAEPASPDDPLEEGSEPQGTVGARRKRRVVVVTGNIALQEQIVTKDLPTIRRVTGWPFQWVLLKGRSNYACHRAIHDLEQDAKGRLLDNDTAEIGRLKDWFKRSRTGDKSEIDPSPTPADWGKITSTSDDCGGRKCPFFDECYYYGQRRKARDAEVIVTNYSFLMTELKLRREIGVPSLMLPEFDILVCDEAHDMGEIARRFFSAEIKTSRFTAVGRLLANPRVGLKTLADKVWGIGRDFDGLGATHAAVNKDSGSMLFRPANYVEFCKRIVAVAVEVEKAAAERWKQWRIDHGIADWVSISDMDEAAQKAMEGIMRPARMMTGIAADAEIIWPEVEQDDVVYYVEGQREQDRKTFYSFIACPFSCAPMLQEELWDHTDRAILTSATLASMLKAADGRSRFQFVREELGLAGEDRPCYEEIVESPFDFHRQMGVYIDTALDPTTSTPEQYADVIEGLIRASRGRALVLFTSHAQMDKVHFLVAPRLKYRCFKQGEGSRLNLTEKFRRDVSSCLFATRSFFQGVDVQGESLSLLILDKIPFPMMNDPFIAKAKAKGEATGDRWGWFMGLSIPKAMMLFRQAIGRLIRSKTDTGVVAVLDSRISAGQKSYGKQFREAVMSDRILGSAQEVADFFGTEQEPEPVAPPTSVADDKYGYDDDIPF